MSICHGAGRELGTRWSKRVDKDARYYIIYRDIILANKYNSDSEVLHYPEPEQLNQAPSFLLYV